jgi:polyadenylate-binding protein
MQELNEKVFGNATLYVRPALTKLEREKEKKKDTYRYKKSKQRCNLYVKNFPPNTTEEELRTLFSPYGQIDSIKLFPKENESLYGFICFKNPDEASRAKAELH